MNRKKVLLLGGTGAMGDHLTRLLNQDFDVYVTSRKARTCPGVTYIQGNAHNSEFLQRILNEQHYEVIVDFMIYGTEEFSKRVEILLSKVNQYVFLSSSRVYADSENPIKENSPRLLDSFKDEEFLQTDEYALSKAREEDILRKSGRKNWTIIRPYITYSEKRLQLGVLEKEGWLFRAMNGRTIIFSEDIADKTTTLTYGHDVARGIASIIGKDDALSQTFHITVDESHTWAEIFNLYIDVLKKNGVNPKVKMTKEIHRIKSPGSKWQVLVDRYYNRRFNCTNIKRFIDTSSFEPTMVGLEKCLNVFLKNPSFTNVGGEEQAIFDKISGEYTPLYQLPNWKQKVKYVLYRFFIPQMFYGFLKTLVFNLKSKV